MSNVTVLRTTPAVDGYHHLDVIADGDGILAQRAPLPGQWLRFGERYETPADQIPQPWTLVCRAGETTDLVRARQWAMELESQLAYATSFDLSAGEFPDEVKVGIDRRADDTWVVVRGHSTTRPVQVLGTDGKWHYERELSVPDDFYRFTLTEAFERAHGLLREVGE